MPAVVRSRTLRVYEGGRRTRAVIAGRALGIPLVVIGGQLADAGGELRRVSGANQPRDLGEDIFHRAPRHRRAVGDQDLLRFRRLGLLPAVEEHLVELLAGPAFGYF